MKLQIKSLGGLFQSIRDFSSRGAKIGIAGSDEIQLDDGVSLLSADDYVVLRVIPTAALINDEASSGALLAAHHHPGSAFNDIEE